MRKVVCACAILSLICAVGYASDAVKVGTPAHPPIAKYNQGAMYAGHLVYDAMAHKLVNGSPRSRVDTIYDNTQAAQGGNWTATLLGFEYGDDLSMTGGGVVSELGVSVVNGSNSAGPLSAVDITFRFYDRANDALIDTGGTPVPLGTIALTGVAIDPPLDPGFFVTLDITNLDSHNVTLPIWTMMSVTFANPQGGADDNLGQALYHGGLSTPYPTMDQGESGDHFANNEAGWGYFYFGGPGVGPWADMYNFVGVAAKNPTVLFDSGCSHTINEAGTEYYVGYSSGMLPSVSRPQRWTAIPFRLAANSTITQINFNWFVGADCQTIKYKIFRLNNLNTAPVPADLVSQGNLGPYNTANGVMDRRIHLSADTTFQQYGNLNIALNAGSYYLTLYGEDPNDGLDHNIAILTGGMLMPDDLEQHPDPPSFMWRAATYPTPGFVQYTIDGGGVNVPGLEMATDPDQWADMYNVCFQLISGAAPICRGDANCNGSVGFDDINPFVLALSYFSAWRTQVPNCPLGNVDINGDGAVNFGDINPFVALLSQGGGPCH